MSGAGEVAQVGQARRGEDDIAAVAGQVALAVVSECRGEAVPGPGDDHRVEAGFVGDRRGVHRGERERGVVAGHDDVVQPGLGDRDAAGEVDVLVVDRVRVGVGDGDRHAAGLGGEHGEGGGVQAPGQVRAQVARAVYPAVDGGPQGVTNEGACFLGVGRLHRARESARLGGALWVQCQRVGGAGAFDAAKHAGRSERIGKIGEEQARRDGCGVDAFAEVSVVEGGQRERVGGEQGALAEADVEDRVQAGAVGEHVHGVTVVGHHGVGAR